MPTIPLTENASRLFEVPEVDERTLARATPHTFTATANSTTVIRSPLLTGANAYDYLGCWLAPETGVEAGNPRQIVAFDPANDDATVLPAWDNAPGNVRFRMWRPSEPVARSRSAAAGVDAVDADADADAGGTPGRDEAAEFWSDFATASTLGSDRYVMWGRRGSNINRQALIVNDAAVAASEKVFTLETGSGWVAGAAGDFAVIRKHLRHMGGSIVLPDTTREIIERPLVKGASERGETEPHALGRRLPGAALAIDLEVQPVGAAASGASVARAPAEAGDLLDSICAVESDGTSAIVGGTAAAPTVTTAQGERFDVGNLILIEGEVAQIRSIVDGGIGADTLNISPALSQAAPAAAVVQGGINFTPVLDGFRSHTIEAFVEDRRILAFGWIPNLRVQGVVGGGLPTLHFEGPFDSWIADGYVYPASPSSSQGGDRFPVATIQMPILSDGGRAVLTDTSAGAAAVSLDHGIEFSIDIGYAFARVPNVHGFAGADGIWIGNPGRNTTGTLKVFAPGDLRYLRHLTVGSELELLIQCGTALGRTFAIMMPRIQITAAPTAFEDGAAVHSMEFRVRRTGIDGTDDTSGATVTTRIRDITLGWM